MNGSPRGASSSQQLKGTSSHSSGNGIATHASGEVDASAAALERRWPWKKRGLSERERFEIASKLVTMLSYLATEEDGM